MCVTISWPSCLWVVKLSSQPISLRRFALTYRSCIHASYTTACLSTRIEFQSRLEVSDGKLRDNRNSRIQSCYKLTTS